MAPVIAFSFSLLCFAPLTQSAIESEEPVAYVNFSFASHVEAAVDRNFNVVSFREPDGRQIAVGSDTRYAHSLSFGQFTEALISRINSNGEFQERHSLLFSAAVTKQVTGRERKVLHDRLVQTFVSQTLKYIPGARFHTVTEPLSGRTGAADTQTFTAVKNQLHPRESLQQTIVSVKNMKILSVSGIGISSFSTPLQKLVEKIKDTGETSRRPRLEGLSYPIRTVHTLFQNPFGKIQQNDRGTPSSYLFPGRRIAASIVCG